MTTPPTDRRPLFRRPDTTTDPDPAPTRPGLRRLAVELALADPAPAPVPAEPPPAAPGRRPLARPGTDT